MNNRKNPDSNNTIGKVVNVPSTEGARDVDPNARGKLEKAKGAIEVRTAEINNANDAVKKRKQSPAVEQQQESKSLKK